MTGISMVINLIFGKNVENGKKVDLLIEYEETI